jgi:hypothetical protein
VKWIDYASSVIILMGFKIKESLGVIYVTTPNC